jgi:hypothetical protein
MAFLMPFSCSLLSSFRFFNTVIIFGGVVEAACFFDSACGTGGTGGGSAFQKLSKLYLFVFFSDKKKENIKRKKNNRIECH